MPFFQHHRVESSRVDLAQRKARSNPVNINRDVRKNHPIILSRQKRTDPRFLCHKTLNTFEKCMLRSQTTSDDV